MVEKFQELRDEAENSGSWVVIGHYGGQNTGDDSMLAALLYECQSMVHRITVVSKDGMRPDWIWLNSNVRFISTRAIAFIKEFVRCRGIILGGGTHFHDDYVWLRYLRHLRYMTRFVLICILARIFQKKVIALGMGLGPFYRVTSRLLTKLGLSCCNFVCVRDRSSLGEAARMCDKSKLALGFDLAALLVRFIGQPKKDDGTIGVSATSVAKTLTAGPSIDKAFWDSFMCVLGKLMKELPVKVRIFVFRGGSREDDNELSDRIYRYLRCVDASRVEIVPYNPDPISTLREIARCDSFFATRFHSGVLAYLAGCNLALFGYHRKLVDLAREIGLSDRAVIRAERDVSVEDLYCLMKGLIGGESAFTPTIPVEKAAQAARINIEGLARFI